MESYITVSKISTAQYSEKRSKFVATLTPCQNEAQALNIISQTKNRCFDARHNAYAYILKDSTAKFSDDGEPHGTAGKPIFDVLSGSGIVDAVIVVTRYFGGVLLGTGGLVRAYSGAAKGAVESAEIIQMCNCVSVSIECDYTHYSKLSALAVKYGAVIENTEFTNKISLSLRIRSVDFDDFKNDLRDAFSSKLSIKDQKSVFSPMNLKK